MPIERSRAFGRELLRGVVRYGNLHGSWMSYIEPKSYKGDAGRSYKWMRDLEADGIIAYTWDPRLIQTIFDYGLPALIRGIEDPVSKAYPIRTDQAAAGRMAAEYFLERGFQRFAYCGFIDVAWSEQRGAHFGRRVAEAGFDTYFYQPSNAGRLRTIDKERMIIAKWLQSLPKPIAVMACNDDRSRDIIAACRLAGVNVPREIALLGVDNDEFICELPYPQLSSIALSTERAGYEAASVLDRLMKGERIKKADAIVCVCPSHVVTRQSTDVMIIDDPDVAEAVHFIRTRSREPILVSEVGPVPPSFGATVSQTARTFCA